MQDQVKLEIRYTLWSVPWISLPTSALFFFEVRGHSKLYGGIDHSALGDLQFQLSVACIHHMRDDIQLNPLCCRLPQGVCQHHVFPIVHRHAHLLDPPFPSPQNNL